LEQAVSDQLGTKFTFDAHTPLDALGQDGGDPVTRVVTMGNFLKAHCCAHGAPRGGEQLRVLVLDDFNITPMGTWCCDGHKMDTTADVEQFLCSQLPPSVNGTVMVQHTFDEWRASGGMLIRVGSGLTLDVFESALDFLERRVSSPVLPSVCAYDGQPAHDMSAEDHVDKTFSGPQSEGGAASWMLKLLKQLHESAVNIFLAAHRSRHLGCLLGVAALVTRQESFDLEHWAKPVAEAQPALATRSPGHGADAGSMLV
jgi:hypothetical protein